MNVMWRVIRTRRNCIFKDLSFYCYVREYCSSSFESLLYTTSPSCNVHHLSTLKSPVPAMSCERRLSRAPFSSSSTTPLGALTSSRAKTHRSSSGFSNRMRASRRAIRRPVGTLAPTGPSQMTWRSVCRHRCRTSPRSTCTFHTCEQ